MFLSKSITLSTIKLKLIAIYILNLTDIIFTFILLNTGVFYEANPLMQKFINDPIKSLILKGVVPALLIIFVYARMKKATKLQLSQSNVVINLCLLLYFLINLSHLSFLTLLFVIYI